MYSNIGDYSSRDYYYGLYNSEHEVSYLKLKLIYTHEKYLHEVEMSQQLEEKFEAYRGKYEQSLREIDNLNRKIATLEKEKGHFERERIKNDKNKQFYLALVQTSLIYVYSEKKNYLMRVDLDSMRTKILTIMNNHHQMEEKIQYSEHIIEKLTEKHSQLLKYLKSKYTEGRYTLYYLYRYRNKYDKQVSNYQLLEVELQNLKKYNYDLNLKYESAELNYRQEKERGNKTTNEIHTLQRYCKYYRNKYDLLVQESNQHREYLQMLKAKGKNEDKNTVYQLYKLTQYYNSLIIMYKNKEKYLDMVRRKEYASPRKSTFEQTKELVNKLEKYEQAKVTNRYNSRHKTPPKTYKDYKKEYLNMIGEVGTMYSQLLNYNMYKKQILSEIDKIDETRVKTKEMISRRRRLEVEHMNVERKLEHVKTELKKMKVM